jgi:putative tryptophan/tyrosine transport system substrate-binding protein
MNKRTRVAFASLAIAAAFSLPAAAAPSKLRIAIVQPMSHKSLDQIRDTIVAELRAAAQASGRNFEITTQDAHGDTSSLPTIFQNVKGKGVDIVVPIATPSAQSAKSVFGGTKTPIVFAAVSDPVAAGLTGEDAKNITGVSNSIPSDKIVQLVSDFQPKYKKLGFLYTSSETNSVSTIKAAKAYCDKAGIAYAEASVATASDLQSAVNSLLAKGVDALYTGNDNTIASAMPAYTDAAYSKGVPIYCGADSMVADGGLATIGIDYVQLGRQVAALIVKIADGAAPAALPYETLSDYAKFVNLQAADKLKLSLSAATLKSYKALVEKDGTSRFGK